MNILQIGTIDNRGGAAIVSWELRNKLMALGHTVNMFVGIKYSQEKNVFQIPRKKYQDYLVKIFANDLIFAKTDYILKTPEFKNADIIHCHNLHSNFFNLNTLSKISKIKPVVWTQHDLWAFTGGCTDELKCKNPKPRKFLLFLWDNTNYLLRKKNAIYKKSKLNIVVPSVWLKRKIEKSILKDQNISLIYNGIDNSIFKKYEKNKTRQELNLPLNKKIILFIAKGGKKNILKGWQYIEKIISYYKNNKNILFVCIGEENNQQGEHLGGNNIKYINYIKDKKILAKYFSSADLFLYPSLADVFGLVAAESLSCGTPIVAFKTGGIPEIVIHKKNGYIAEYQNTDDLINGIEYIFKLNDDEINKMSENSIQRVKENFTLDIMINNYLKLYKKILNQTSN